MRIYHSAFTLVLIFAISGCLKLVKKEEPPATGEVFPEVRVHEFFPEDPAKNEILSVYAKQGTLWTGTREGLFAYSLPALRPLQKQAYLAGQKIIDLAGS